MIQILCLVMFQLAAVHGVYNGYSVYRDYQLPLLGANIAGLSVVIFVLSGPMLVDAIESYRVSQMSRAEMVEYLSSNGNKVRIVFDDGEVITSSNWTE